jgi:CDGSH-type Zn-finger protein
MDKPKIAGRKPIAIDLTKGEEKYFCACGESKSQPFCDGSHRTTPFKPLAFTPEKTETAYLCMCKQSKNLPYCDGTHATLKEEII